MPGIKQAAELYAQQAERSAGETHIQGARRLSLELANKLLLGGVFLSMPAALWALAYGSLLPFFVSIVALTSAFSSLSLLKRDKATLATDTSSVGIFVVGTTLTLADPSIVDFGLAIILLVPVLASLMGNKAAARHAYILCLIGVAAAAIGATGFHEFSSNGRAQITITALLTYAVLTGIAVIAAHRMAAAVDDFDRAQIDTFRHLIEHAQHAVIRMSPAGEVTFISRSSEAVFGCNRYELVGSGILDRMQVQDRPAYLNALSDAHNKGAARHIEARLRKDCADHPSGPPVFNWMEINVSPVIGDGKRRGRFEVILLIRDISRRKMQEKQMLEAREIAQEASEAKSRFLATIGHELRTPLNAVVGFSDMMMNEISGTLDEGQLEYAKLINKSGLHLLDIVNMLLDVSKIEAGRFDLEIEEFAAASLVEPCVRMVSPLAQERDIAIKTEVSPRAPLIRADERACRQILINLLSNAIKFSHAGSEVRVGLKRQGMHILLSVADDGVGMSRSVVERVGEPFFQAQQSLSRQFEGTGLGMSIVKGLIELHGGRLQVASEPGKGTTMTAILPIGGPSKKVHAAENVVHTLQVPEKPQPELIETLPRRAVQ